MLYVFGFDRFGVALSDLYFVDPNPAAGQEGAERGVRLEVRMLEPDELRGSIYSAQPISLAKAVWRVDLLESVDGRPGSFDRTHHHPAFHDWEPGQRVFVRELSARPLDWLGARLANLEEVLDEAGVARDEVTAADAASLRACVPEILDATRRLLDKVRAGALGRQPSGEPLTSARAGWL
jgi:hypothetical protein